MPFHAISCIPIASNNTSRVAYRKVTTDDLVKTTTCRLHKYHSYNILIKYHLDCNKPMLYYNIS